MGKGTHQMDLAKMATPRPHRAKAGSKRLLYGNFLSKIKKECFKMVPISIIM